MKSPTVSKAVLAILLSVSIMGSFGCSAMKVKPWVSPYERNNLADPIMSFNRSPVAAA